VAFRFGAVQTPGTIGADIGKAARAKGLSTPLADYLETIARRHEMIARAFRLAVRAANGESIETLCKVSLDEDWATPTAAHRSAGEVLIDIRNLLGLKDGESTVDAVRAALSKSEDSADWRRVAVECLWRLDLIGWKVEPSLPRVKPESDAEPPHALVRRAP
jgi:hypothetical protein